MTLEERVEKACEEPSEMDDLIRDYIPFIKAVIAKTLKKYIKSDDAELSTGMMGFHEAVIKYDPTKGGFLSYAQLVIRNRIVDQIRKEEKLKANGVIAIDSDNDDNIMIRAQNTYAMEIFEKKKSG